MSGLDERREQHKRYKGDVQRRGKSFFPYAMFHDTVMSLVVVLTIIVLTVIWYYTAPGHDEIQETPEPGWLGKLYDEKADAGTTTFIPRPDWYFYFLFYLLRIFKWPDSVILGTIGIPTIALVLLLMFPFLDRRMERRPSRRPVAMIAGVLVIITMGVLTYKGATAKEGAEAVGLVPEWVQKQNFAETAPKVPGAGPNALADATDGATFFAESGCQSCHTYLGSGSSNLGAPDLTEEGTKNRGIEWQVRHLRDPQSTTPGSAMPAFAQLGDENLNKLAIFLEASQGEQ